MGSASPRLRSTSGQALIEAAVTLPILLLLLLNLINFGLYMYAWITVNNAARAVAEYRAYTGVVVGLPPSPTLSQMQCVLSQEVSTLPNRGAATGCTWSNVKLEVCTTSCIGDSLTIGPRTDDPGNYAMYSIEVSYAYTPLIPAFTLPVIGIPLTLLPTTIDRSVVVRSME